MGWSGMWGRLLGELRMVSLVLCLFLQGTLHKNI